MRIRSQSSQFSSRKSTRRPDMEREYNVETTLGELIVALTEETFRHVHDEKTANILVAYILSDLFHNTEPISTCWH